MKYYDVPVRSSFNVKNPIAAEQLNIATSVNHFWFDELALEFESLSTGSFS